MKFSYNWIQSYFNDKLPPIGKMAELLTMHAFETTDDGNDVLDIEILPNRVSDCASHLGIARECAAILNYKLQITNYKLQKSDFQTKDFVELEVKDSKLCLRYIAWLCRDVKIGPSPQWLKDRLISVGLRPISNVVDIANYVMLETGQPLHTFDLDKIGGRKIVVRKAGQGEKMETLDNRKAVLSADMLVIADAEEPMAIAGIKGGKKSGIGPETKDIVIESAIFAPFTIRQTSKSVGISTDASFRFEHGISLFLAEQAAERAAGFIAELAGGRVASTAVDFCPQKPVLEDVVFGEEDVLRILGKKVRAEDITKILKNLGFSVKKTGKKFSVTPPKERTDIAIKEDVAEEIGRLWGYENIFSQLPGETKISPELDEEYVYSNWVRSVLTGLGFSEVYNYSFCKTGAPELKLENPASQDKAYLRTNLAAGLGESIKHNLKNFDAVRIFEIGKVFFPEEKTRVGIAIGYKNGGGDAVAELRGAAEALFISDADKYIKDDIFEINLKQIIDAAKENSVDLTENIGFETGDFEYKAFSRYPAIIRDISLFVSAETGIEEVTDVIENMAGELLINSDLFDEYTPPDEDRKSLAFRLVFQSFAKTLTDKEVNDIMEKIIKALEENTQWQVRK